MTNSKILLRIQSLCIVPNHSSFHVSIDALSYAETTLCSTLLHVSRTSVTSYLMDRFLHQLEETHSMAYCPILPNSAPWTTGGVFNSGLAFLWQVLRATVAELMYICLCAMALQVRLTTVQAVTLLEFSSLLAPALVLVVDLDAYDCCIVSRRIKHSWGLPELCGISSGFVSKRWRRMPQGTKSYVHFWGLRFHNLIIVQQTRLQRKSTDAVQQP